MQKLLDTPFPRQDYTSYLKFAFISGVIVAFVLMIFQPFGTASFEHDYKFLILAGYGIVITSMVALYYYISSKYFYKKHTDSWTVVKEVIDLMICVLVVVVAVYFYFIIVFNLEFYWKHFVYFIGISLSVALIPVMGILIYLYSQWKYVIRSEISTDASSSTGIVLKGQNKNDLLTVGMDELILAKAQDNYVMLYLEKDENIQRHILRATLKEIKNQLNEEFLQVHRSFILNKNKIVRLEGNKSKSHLIVEKVDFLIPVSRTMYDQLKMS